MKYSKAYHGRTEKLRYLNPPSERTIKEETDDIYAINAKRLERFREPSNVCQFVNCVIY